MNLQSPISRLSLAWHALTKPLPAPLPRETQAQFIDRSLRDFFKEDAVTGMAASKDWSQHGTIRDKPLPRRMEDLSSALAAWRTNPLARRIVNLTRDHVWGRGMRPSSKNKVVSKWLDRFWNHEMNLMEERWPQWIDALTLDGEIFPTFFQSEADGMTIVRALAAAQIEDIKWQAGDYEQLTAFGQRVSADIELKWWTSLLVAQPGTPCAWQYAVNRPIAVIRGDGDLTPILPWLAYYSDWLEDRVERNAVLTKFYYHVTVEDAADIEDAKKHYAAPPADGTVVVSSAGEKHEIMQPKIGADDAKADGYALRTMVAVGGNVPIHWLSEPGEGSSEATSNNMNDVSYRHYETRQNFVKRRILHLCQWAYNRAVAVGSVRYFIDPGITVSVSDISRSDNQQLAASARELATGFATMIEKGLDKDRRLVRMIYRFAGEDLDEEEIAEIVARAERRAPPSENPKGTPQPAVGAVREPSPPEET
jgi:hypothetical protein